MTLKLIACEVMYRELCFAVARSPHLVDIEFLPKGLHDLGAEGMQARMREAVERLDESRYDAIILGYGLCNNGLQGLTARSIPIVIPRAHDCITVFFGSKERYITYFHANPGTYFLTSGWIERGTATGDLAELSIQHQTGMDSAYEDLVAKYGEDNAKYLYEMLCDNDRHYKQFTYIEMGIEPDDRFEQHSRRLADERGWAFRKEAGNLGLITRLVNGDWNDEDFLIVPPGHRIVANYDENVMTCEKDAP